VRMWAAKSDKNPRALDFSGAARAGHKGEGTEGHGASMGAIHLRGREKLLVCLGHSGVNPRLRSSRGPPVVVYGDFV